MNAQTADVMCALLTRIAQALERLAPAAPPEPDFAGARLFRFETHDQSFTPAPDFDLPLDLLVGVDAQKRRLGETLRRFAQGGAFNHALLWGARGTGKSSLAKAVFMDLARGDDGLKMVELDRDAVAALPGLFARLRGRPERFVVLCDDLSFEEGAAAAKALKSALEGGVAGPPPNVVFVATSNRRHLMPRGHDEAGGALSAAEDAEEMVSASDRFGLWLGFTAMDQAGYLAAVRGYVERFDLGDPGLAAPELAAPDLDRRALQWAQLRGARSGRVASQFVRELAGARGRRLPY